MEKGGHANTLEEMKTGLVTFSISTRLRLDTALMILPAFSSTIGLEPPPLRHPPWHFGGGSVIAKNLLELNT
jgi:hypothetical protein